MTTTAHRRAPDPSGGVIDGDMYLVGPDDQGPFPLELYEGAGRIVGDDAWCLISDRAQIAAQVTIEADGYVFCGPLTVETAERFMHNTDGLWLTGKAAREVLAEEKEDRHA